MKFLPSSATRTLGRTVLKTKKNSPHIFFGLGVAGVLGGTVMACRATLKAEETLEEVQDGVTAVKEMAAPRIVDLADDYSEKDYRRDLGRVYLSGAGGLARLYAPSAAVMGLSIISLTGSHVQLTNRNAALTATLTAVSTAYENYREAVKEKLGEDTEREVFFGARQDAVEHTDGTKEVVTVVDGIARSEYAVCFDEFNVNWDRSPGYNQAFLTSQQNYWNMHLESHGHVFLNDIYEKLGFEHTPAGAVCGWIWDGDGDNYIDFDMFSAYNENFINGHEKSIWLDFNVDGVIYDLI